MQFILSEQELNCGCQLILSFSTDEIALDEVYLKQQKLNKQGFFTVIRDLVCDECEEPKFIIDAYRRNSALLKNT